MRLRQLVLACGLSSFVLSPYASALGLGEVKLKSSLNQPLEAEVKLLDTRDLTAEQILVTLASPADFERNGVDRLYFYTELQFQVDLDSADGPKVIIRSRNPVREPYLNFLIEARWTAGRLLREYTLLMDLPTFDEDARSSSVVAPAAAITTSTRQSAPAVAPRSSVAESASPSRKSAVESGAPISPSEYEVRANDTLWEIAMRVRQDSGVSVHQSMMALYRANPDAFINGNINKLRRGQVLRVPDASEMRSVGKTEAVNQFAQATGDSNYGAQLNASRRSSSTQAESAEVSGRVKLAAPSAGSNAGQGSGANDGAGRALESELAATLEELDKTKSENTELGSRVKDLEAQIETMERLVAVSNEKLRALQVAAGQEPAKPDSAPAEIAQVSSAALQESALSSAAAAVQPPLPAAPKPKPVVQQPKPEPSLVESVTSNPLLLALAGLGVLGVGGAAYAYRRRKEQQEQQHNEDENQFTVDESLGEQDEPSFHENNDISEEIDSSLFEDDSERTAVAETGDVVGEADIYIAYGKLDQAEEMLINALEKDPNSTDIRMKLLEVYAQQQNAPSFDKHYALLLPMAGAALISKASELRETISGASDYSADADVASEVSDDFGADFSLDGFDSDDSASSATQTVADSDNATSSLAGDAETEFNFDFDLDLDDDESTIASLASGDAPALDGDSASEFDFDLSELDESASAEEGDKVSELSIAFGELDSNHEIGDASTEGKSAEEEFTFDFDDDLALSDAEPDLNATGESLEVIADDFNLDMNVEDVDLAALDHEMESLDVDFDDEAALDEEPAIAEFVAGEIAKDEAEFGLDLDDDIAPLHGSDDLELLAEDLGSTKLNLTDDLDKVGQVDFGPATIVGDDEFNLSMEDDSGSSLELDSGDFDLADLDEEFAGLDQQVLDPVVPDGDKDIVDLELHDEIPGQVVDLPEVASGFDAPLSAEAEQDLPGFEQPLEVEQDEDLFAEALSDFASESDELNLESYSSGESELAGLSDDDMDSELDFLADADEAATKLDLARAYIDMGDIDGAKDILTEVVSEGSEEQRNEANELLGRIV
ncbi:FimV/HubP family polar landmark protein [Cellvibrio fontiphilus]|uniref:FimV/HubP family polar landmark protein n=1 Tax=Cellvibrio fontiphilus TaxID=1815559 RepID=A0ABV7FJK2_9GAMM